MRALPLFLGRAFLVEDVRSERNAGEKHPQECDGEQNVCRRCCYVHPSNVMLSWVAASLRLESPTASKDSIVAGR